DDDVGIDDVDDRPERSRETVFVAGETCQRALLTAASPARNLARVDLGAAGRAVVVRQPGAGKKRLDTAGTAAVARPSRQLVAAWCRQRIVAPLARDRVAADNDVPVDDDAAAGSGSKDGGEDHVDTCCGAVCGF